MRMLPKRPLHLIFNIFKRFSILLCEVYFHKTTSHLHNTNVRMHGVGFVKVGQEIKNTRDQDCFFFCIIRLRLFVGCQPVNQFQNSFYIENGYKICLRTQDLTKNKLDTDGESREPQKLKFLKNFVLNNTYPPARVTVNSQAPGRTTG